MLGKILSINISAHKGKKKKSVPTAKLIKDGGIEGDAHFGCEKQVSFLAQESINKMGATFNFGDFAENITTEGISLLDIPLNSRIKVGDTAILEIIQRGKTCHHGCEIFQIYGKCIMPEEGIFGNVIEDGEIKIGDKIKQL